MSTVVENISENQGTFSSENGQNVPANSIDLESDAAQKAFEEAFNKAAGISEPTKVVTEPEKPALEEPVKAEKETPVVQESVVKEDKETVTEPVTKETVPEAQKKDDPYAWVGALPQDVQDKIRKEIETRSLAEHRLKSDVGRQNALQQKSLRLERELADLRSRVLKPQDPELAAAAKADQAKSLADWNTLIEADPSLAKAVETRIQAELSALEQKFEQRINAQTDPLYQHSLDTYAERERQLLQSEVPNYQEVISSPVFSYWVSNIAAPGLQKLASDSNDHRDAITVLKAYSNDAQGVYEFLVNTGQMQALPVQETAKTEPAKQVEVKDTSHADKVAQSRQQKVQTAPVIPTSPNPIATPKANSLGTSRPGDAADLDDAATLAMFEDAFKKYSARR